MSQLYGVDVSEFQGDINWDQLNAVSNFAIIRASFGTARKDYKFARNQSEARRVQAAAGPLGIGYYYYAYTSIDPVVSAKYFIDNLWPMQTGEILALDLEGQIGNNPVDWSLKFLQHCEVMSGVKPLIYINQSILNGYNWSPVINNGNGLWIAQYDYKQKAPAVHGAWPFAAMKQWTDKAKVAGISGNVDGDTFNGTFDQFYAYGYNYQPSPPPTTTTTLPPPPVTESTTTTLPATSQTTTTLPPSPEPPPDSVPPSNPPYPDSPSPPSLLDRIIAWLRKLFNREI